MFGLKKIKYESVSVKLNFIHSRVSYIYIYIQDLVNQDLQLTLLKIDLTLLKVQLHSNKIKKTLLNILSGLLLLLRSHSPLRDLDFVLLNFFKDFNCIQFLCYLIFFSVFFLRILIDIYIMQSTKHVTMFRSCR